MTHEQKNHFINNSLSASMSLLGILVGVVGLLVAKYLEIEDQYYAWKFIILIVSSTILTLLTGTVAFLSILFFKFKNVPTHWIFNLLVVLIISVSIGVPLWAISTII